MQPRLATTAAPSITPDDVRSANRALDAAGLALARLPIAAIIGGIDAAIALLQRPDGALRETLLADGPALTGYSREALLYGVETMLNQCRAPTLLRLIETELGDAALLDGFVAGTDGVLRHARGPGRQLHIYAGTVPTAPVIGIVSALLLKSPVLVKPSQHDPLLPALVARALGEAAPELGAAVAVLPWRGGDSELEDAALAGIGALLVHGTDATVAAWRRRAPPAALFAGHGHRVSLALIGREALTRARAADTARRLAWDVGLFDGRGCLSCRSALIEQGAETAPAEFGALVAEALATLERRLPRGAVAAAESAHIQALRDTTALRQAAGQDVHLWSSERDTTWTVVYDGHDANAALKLAPPGRVALLAPIDDLSNAAQMLAKLPLSTIGLDLPESRSAALAPALSGVATRLCALGRMGEPPLNWRQDGAAVLAGFVRWIERDI
jgi:acyl-CoA reductase-like NAD-dependent aldehyde dehydrogenase